MILLAGGLVEMQAMTLQPHEVGMGVVRLTPEHSVSMAKAHGGRESDWQNLIIGGDYGNALELALMVSGGEEEGAAWFEWLEQRTRSLIRRFDFLPSVEDVTGALMGIGRSLCYELVRRGELPSVSLGGRRVVPMAALTRMLNDAVVKVLGDSPPTGGNKNRKVSEGLGETQPHPVKGR